MKRRDFTRCATALAIAATAPAAFGQNWPDKTVKLLLSQPAGSGADAMARMISDQLAKKWSQSIVVENRPGGQNVIGAQAAARSPADGYTFYFATAAALVTNPYLIKNLPYDPQKDFVPVGMVGKVPFVLSVNAGSQFKTLADLVTYAKANPGRLAVANEGPKTFGGMMTRLLASQLGIQVNSVSYVSVGAAVTDTVGGQVEVLLSDLPSAVQMIRSGKLRPLGVTTAQRVSGLENVPSIADTLPGFDFAGWLVIVAPAGTPTAVVQRANRDLDAVLTDKDIASRLLAIGPITEGAGTVDQTGAFLRREYERWGSVTKAVGILPE
ncbi:Bug family tripartite tricarboxylate transporter substrate binding protein [Ottowia thiooxydans]|uniref:Tripartite-type tricarboxylate transporter receptor subunit TctC n=1 Tax=Ottowia thiooxydans TaxID=219182 RepID=A0ABV2Q8V9_9BURK